MLCFSSLVLCGGASRQTAPLALEPFSASLSVRVGAASSGFGGQSEVNRIGSAHGRYDPE